MTTESHDFIQLCFDNSVQLFLFPIRLSIVLFCYISSAIISWVQSVIRDFRRYPVLNALLDRTDLVYRLTEDNQRLTWQVEDLRKQNSLLRSK